MFFSPEPDLKTMKLNLIAFRCFFCDLRYKVNLENGDETGTAALTRKLN